jgi:hypothetical protein
LQIKNNMAFEMKNMAYWKTKNNAPFKDAPEESHQGYEQAKKAGKTHTHFKSDDGRWHESEYGFDMDKKFEEVQDTGASEEETSKMVSGISDEQRATLLTSINKARVEQGLPPAKTLEEGLQTTPTYK